MPGLDLIQGNLSYSFTGNASFLPLLHMEHTFGIRREASSAVKKPAGSNRTISVHWGQVRLPCGTIQVVFSVGRVREHVLVPLPEMEMTACLSINACWMQQPRILWSIDVQKVPGPDTMEDLLFELYLLDGAGSVLCTWYNAADCRIWLNESSINQIFTLLCTRKVDAGWEYFSSELFQSKRNERQTC